MHSRAPHHLKIIQLQKGITEMSYRSVPRILVDSSRSYKKFNDIFVVVVVAAVERERGIEIVKMP